MKIRTHIVALIALAATFPLSARDVDYTLDLPAKQKLRYEVEFEIRHPGTLAVELDWDTSRVLSFRVDPPDDTASSFRRSGPPPQRLLIEVGEDHVGGEPPWKLTILGLPSRTAASGRLRLVLPDPPEQNPPPDAASGVETAGVAQPEPWMLPIETPSGLSPAWRRMFAASESLRARVLEGEGAALDSCRWQGSLIQFLAERRNDRNAGSAPVDAPTGRMMARIADAIEQVGRLQGTRDPVLTEPRPDDPARRRAWKSMRARRLEPVRDALDQIFSDLQAGYAPELRDEAWPSRLITCTMACERQLEKRAVDGPDEPSPGMLVEVEWPRILAAAETLRSLSELAGP